MIPASFTDRNPLLEDIAATGTVQKDGRRFAQNPLEPDLALKRVPTNVGVLRKAAEQYRPWNYHCPF